MSVLAWLAPWCLGGGLWLLCRGLPRRPAEWCAAIGGGWLLGALLTGLLVQLFAALVSPQSVVRLLGPGMLLAGIAMSFAAWRWRRPAAPVPAWRVDWRWVLAGAVVVLLLVLRLPWMWREATLPPLFPWDAWTAWSVKPATWFQLDRWVEFRGFDAWLASGDAGVFTSEAVGYPAWLGRLEVWYAAGAGCWCDPAFTPLWPVAWVALLLLVSGQLRVLGVRAPVALLATYVLGSLPLLDVHAAMAGYADLWLAAFLVLGMLAWLQWRRWRAPACLAVALLALLSLPAVKLEGAVWMLLALAVMALGELSARRRIVALLVLGAVLALLAGLLWAGWRLALPGLGTLFVDADGLHVSGRSAMQLGWYPVAGPVLKSLFVASNWHLLFFAALAWIVLRWRHARDGVRLLGVFLLGALAFVLALFFFTDASAWADNYTSIGRLLLQVVPLLVCLLALLDRGAGRNDGRATAE